MTDATESAPSEPPIPYEMLVKVLGKPMRWAILRELADGERLMVLEIAARVGKSSGAVSKHLAILRQAGLVTISQRLHFIPEELLPASGKEMDLGYCVLRLDQVQDLECE